MDIKVIETLNGGDLELLGADIATVQGFVNMPYLGMFGGNTEENTPTTRPENQQAFDWWGNTALLLSPVLQLNSNTERALGQVALTSQGRVLIEEAVKTDLIFMKPFANITVQVSIIAIDRVKIFIKIQEPDNLQIKEFIWIWDGTRLDLGEPIVTPTAPVAPVLLNFGEQYTDYTVALNSLVFSHAYTTINYTPIVIDYFGAGLSGLTRYTDRIDIDASVPGALLAWLSVLNVPAGGIRSGLTTLLPGLQTINFTTLGDLDYTIIAVDVDGVGADFTGMNASKGIASFEVYMPAISGRIAWVVVKNGYFENIRSVSDVPHLGNTQVITFTPHFINDNYTCLLMDTQYIGTGNILFIDKDIHGAEVTVGTPTRFNMICLLNP